MEAKMAHAIHHHRHTEHTMPDALYWTLGICLAVAALVAFVIAYGGTGMMADSWPPPTPLMW
jgi:predicted Co/Zn/Cd cation transporter (cation efflux family)